MIDAASLRSLTPQARASLIYREAKSAAADRLWQAALGRDGTPPDTGGTTRPRTGGMDDLLQTLLTLTADTSAPSAAVQPADITPAGPPPPSSAVDPVHLGHRRRSDAVAAAAQVGGLGANSRYAPLLDAAATRTGIPAPALAAIVDAEAGKAADGSWQTLSRNRRSSAAGLGQFLSRTWEGLAETGGTWLNAAARANGWLDARGQVTADGRPGLLALRYRPEAAIEGIADFARGNLAGLKRAGVSADGEVGATARLAYLGHHLGLGDAVRFVRDGGLDDGRARRLLAAQIGRDGSDTRIALAGDASAAHREWLLSYLDRKIQPQRYAASA